MNIQQLEAQFAEFDNIRLSPGDIRLVGDSGTILKVRHTRGDGDYPATPPGTHWDPETGTSLPDPPEMEIDLSKVDISDEFIDERIKVAIGNGQRGYLPPVKIMQIGATPFYEVAEDYAYAVDYFAIRREMPPQGEKNIGDPNITPGGNRVPHLCDVTAKKGFQFDRASIPRVFWVILSKDDLSNVPPLFHDLLYRFAGNLPSGYVDPHTTFSRDEADNLFDHLMERSAVRPWRRYIAYQAVHHFASFAWGGD